MVAYVKGPLNRILESVAYPSDESIELRLIMRYLLLRFPIPIYAVFVCLFPAEPLLSVEKPNIIFLFADDQRADTIGFHGNTAIKTPNLDQLASSGYSFRNNYCAGSFSGAVCVASRAMLMTGRHWMRIPTAKK